MDKVTDELSKKELYQIAKEVNPLGSNGSEECDSDVGQEDVRVVEETLPPVDKFTEAMDKHLEHHRGFHPITGEQV